MVVRGNFFVNRLISLGFETESNELDSNPIPLGGKKGVNGELTGTLTGIQYSEGFNKFGFDETGIIAAFGAACIAGPVFCVFGIVGGT